MRRALAVYDIVIPSTHGMFIVACRYDEGEGVREHRDEDYYSDGMPWIVSLNPIGEAVFQFRKTKT